jgi:arginine exporter protein ArgO
MSHTVEEQQHEGRSAVQKGALVVGATFLLVGVLGFVPGVTTDYSQLSAATNSSQAQLLGLFQVSVLHNLLHLGFGVAGILLAKTPLRARNYLFYGGLIYAALFFYGVVVDYESKANIVPLDDADNVLHFVLAAGMLTLAFLLDRGPGWNRVVRQGKARI